MIRETETRLQQCFSHIHQQKKYVFLVLEILRPEIRERTLVMDLILDLSVYTLAREQMIVGLSAVANQFLYFISINQGFWLQSLDVSGNTDTEMDDETERMQYYVYCDWGLDYL